MLLYITTFLWLSCATEYQDDVYDEPYVQQNVVINEEVKEQRLRHVVRAKVTAYAPLDNKSGICADDTPHTTSTMQYPSRGMVAVDPKRIPYGTQMYVPGYGNAVAADTGGALRKSKDIHIDVLVDSYKEAKEWGVKYLDVVIDEES